MKKSQKLFFTFYSFFFIFFNVFSSEHYNTLIVMDKRAEPTSIFLGYNPSYIAPLKINEFDRINIEEIEKIVCESFFNKSICEYLTNYKFPLTKNLSEMNEQMKQIINNDKNQKKIFSEAMEQTFKKANPNIPHVAICRITLISQNNIGYVYPIPYLFLSGSEDSSEKRLMQASIKIVIPFIKTLTSYKTEVSSQQYYAHSERVIAMCLKDPNEPFSLQIRSSHEENLPNINDENFNFSTQFGMFTSSSTPYQVSEQITYSNIANLAS